MIPPDGGMRTCDADETGSPVGRAKGSVFLSRKGGRRPRGFEPQIYKNIGMGGGELLKKVEKYGVIIKNKQWVLVYGK